MVLHGMAWFCMVLHGFAWYCMVLHVIALYCIVLHCIAWYCMILHGIAWYGMVLHGIAWFCMVLHGIAWYYMVLHSTRPAQLAELPRSVFITYRYGVHQFWRFWQQCMSFVCGQTIAIWFAELLHIFLYSTIPLLFVQNCQCIAILLEIVFVLVFCSKLPLFLLQKP